MISGMRLYRIAMRIIPALVVAWALAGCQESSGTPTVVQFWAMGREGEVVRQLIPDFEREHPGVRVEVQQLPWSAAHQKLLTAFAGDALPDVAQLGNTWLPEFVALHALDPVEPSVVDAGDYFPGIWQTNVIDQTAYGVPWYVDTRLLFYRSDLLAEAGYARPPTTWTEWTDMLRAIKQRAGPHRHGALLPLNEYQPLLALALQQEAPLLRDGDTRGNFRSADFKRALRFYQGLFDNGFAPATSANQISNVWDEFARGTFTFYITGPWSIGELKRRLPASLQASWMTAPLPGPEGPSYSVAGGSSLVVFSNSPRKKAGVAARSIPVSARRPAALPRAHGQPAAAAQRMERRRPPQRRPRAGLSRAARARQACSESAGVGAHCHRDAARRRAHGAGQRSDDRRGGCRDRSARRSHSREAALDAGAQGAAVKLNWAAWAFVGPALMVIAVFFFLPVLAGFALSFTDFDIYALADIGNLRFVGLANYVELLQTPLFWKALGNTLYFVGVGVPLSIAASLGAALLLNSKLARFRPFFRVALFAPVVTTLVAVAIVWRYLLHTR